MAERSIKGAPRTLYRGHAQLVQLEYVASSRGRVAKNLVSEDENIHKSSRWFLFLSLPWASVSIPALVVMELAPIRIVENKATVGWGEVSHWTRVKGEGKPKLAGMHQASPGSIKARAPLIAD